MGEVGRVVIGGELFLVPIMGWAFGGNAGRRG